MILEQTIRTDIFANKYSAYEYGFGLSFVLLDSSDLSKDFCVMHDHKIYSFLCLQINKFDIRSLIK